MGHTVSVLTTQLCCYSKKIAIGNLDLNGYRWLPVKLYLQKQGGKEDLAQGPSCSLAIPEKNLNNLESHHQETSQIQRIQRKLLKSQNSVQEIL